MRLIHTRTKQFKEFYEPNIPKYAILSHRWGEEESTYKEFRKMQASGAALRKIGMIYKGRSEVAGLEKIERFCEVAVKSWDLEWAWVDTCCIDKRSSAELTEAINSMYKWYQESALCIVYLADVECTDAEIASLKSRNPDLGFSEDSESASRSSNTAQQLKDKILASSWFTRGWTLQELIAPNSLHFYDASWTRMYDRADIKDEIERKTGIDQWIFFGMSEHRVFRVRWSIAQRMSWASKRVTTRGEDMAYSLLGLFNVNMPLLYGEGAEKAFLRLQLEIIKNSDDETIFSWHNDLYPTLPAMTGMFAPSPAAFANAHKIIRTFAARRPYAMTNKGLELTIPRRHRPEGGLRSQIIFLNCQYEGTPGQIAIVLDINYMAAWPQKLITRQNPYVPDRKYSGDEFHRDLNESHPSTIYLPVPVL